jgi:uncharacterized protein YndB with AHSA1/START domain
MSVDGFERETLIEAPVEVVWRAISQPEHLAGWFCDAAVLEPRPGGKGALTFGDRATHTPVTAPIVVQRLDPLHALAFRWLQPDGADAVPGNSLEVELSLASELGQTRVRVTETGLLKMDWSDAARTAYASEHASGWEIHLSNLREYVREQQRGLLARSP